MSADSMNMDVYSEMKQEGVVIDSQLEVRKFPIPFHPDGGVRFGAQNQFPSHNFEVTIANIYLDDYAHKEDDRLI